MEPSPMNKTSIIEFVIDEVALKLWNTSRRMRKKIKWLLENKTIRIKKYLKIALALNGWVQEGKRAIPIGNKPLRGLSNYEIKSKKDLSMLISLNTPLKCSLNLKEAVKPRIFAFVHSLSITRENYNFYSNLELEHINTLFITKITSEQLNSLFKRIGSVDKLSINKVNLGKCTFPFSRIQFLSLFQVKIENIVFLPGFIEELHICRSSEINFLICRKVNTLNLYNDQVHPSDLKWIRSIAKLKELTVRRGLNINLVCFPNTLRRIQGQDWSIFKDTKDLKDKFPYLLRINDKIPFYLIEELNLRELSSVSDKRDTKFSARPRVVSVIRQNASFLEKHRELLEKAEYVEIKDKSFNLNKLHKRIKIVSFFEFNLDSLILSRFY